MDRKPIKPVKKCEVCGALAEARHPNDFTLHGKGWFDCPHGHGFYSRGFNVLPPLTTQNGDGTVTPVIPAKR